MRRLGLILLAALAAFASMVLPANAAAAAESGGAGSGVSVTRYGGADRYETSLQVAEAVAADADGSLEWVVLVSGRRWTDAVVAAPVAGALGAPVLMTPPDELRTDALMFLQRVGVTKALVIGPDASGGAHGPGRGVGAEVLNALREAGITAERVTGDDRYGTGVAAAGQVTPGAMGDLGRAAVIASGEVFADALVAGPFAARGVHPVLLTPPGGLHADVADYLGDGGIEHVVLMGGTAALNEAVEQAVTDLGIEVTRVAGSTRYDTAVKAAELVEDRYSTVAGRPCFDNDTVGVARARVPFDSFSAAPLLGRLCAPLVLADPAQIPADTAAYLDAAREAHDAVDLRVFGGDAAVSHAALDAYLTGEEPDTAGAGLGVLPAGTCGGSIDDQPSRLVPSNSARYPAWSPDCSRLVYTQNGSLWTVNNDGTGARKLLDHGGDWLGHPVWSPDGKRIAYVRGTDDQHGHWRSHIWTVNVDGGHNNQRTDGDVRDNWPSWSSDSKRIAFERISGSGRDADGNRLDTDIHIVVMTSYGNQPKALNKGDGWERTPAWSPSGNELAYQSSGFVVVSNADGTDARRVIPGVYGGGGLSWSPDGSRIAFVGGDGDESAIVIAEIDGADEQVVFDQGMRAHAPRWSPDGQRIAFRLDDSHGNRWAYVAGASGERVTNGAVNCRPRGPADDTTAGFPLPRWAVHSTGTLRVGVLFMDFPDAQAIYTVEHEAAQGLPWAEQYLEAISYGKLDIEFVPLYRWLRAEQEHAAYTARNAYGTPDLARPASRHAVALADDDIDYSTLDLVMTVFPRSHFGGGNALGNAEADGVTIPMTRVNTTRRSELRDSRFNWGAIAAHEIAHNLGLLDMRPYDRERHVLPELRAPFVWGRVNFGLMSLLARFRIQADDERLQVISRLPGGATSGHRAREIELEEMLGWSRWQLGWLDASQVHCDTGAGATVQLGPIAQPGDAVALAVVPISSREMIVMESRRKIGYDVGRTQVDPQSKAVIKHPGLPADGVLVYTVDTFVGSGELPVKVAGDSGNSRVNDFPILETGESATLRGYTITVTADDGDIHTVTIARAR